MIGLSETCVDFDLGATPLNSYTSHKRYCYHMELKEFVKSKISGDTLRPGDLDPTFFIFSELL